MTYGQCANRTWSLIVSYNLRDYQASRLRGRSRNGCSVLDREILGKICKLALGEPQDRGPSSMEDHIRRWRCTTHLNDREVGVRRNRPPQLHHRHDGFDWQNSFGICQGPWSQRWALKNCFWDLLWELPLDLWRSNDWTIRFCPTIHKIQWPDNENAFLSELPTTGSPSCMKCLMRTSHWKSHWKSHWESPGGLPLRRPTKQSAYYFI